MTPLAGLFALAALLTAPAALAQTDTAPASETETAAQLGPEAQAEVERSRQAAGQFAQFMKSSRDVAKAAKFSGEFGMGFQARRGEAPATAAVAVAAQGADGTPRKANALWRWASVTKQVIAVLVMQEVQAGRIDLDQPVARYLPDFAAPNAARISVRQLLRHQSGLPNPDDSPQDREGVPVFYHGGKLADPPLAYCSGAPKGEPGGKWVYNNCDYIVAGALLEAVTGTPWRDLVTERIARPNKLGSIASFPSDVATTKGLVGGKAEPHYDFARFEASAALYGAMSDLLKFDLALASGKLLDGRRLGQLWDGQADQGFIALGQWVFEAPLKGCTAPVRVVERRGAIGGVQVRNLIVPDQQLAVALFSDQDSFDYGEIWQGKGFAYDMLSLAACPQVMP
ncbi:serine hydrolase [Novosphingobium sp.]|uniref:serine hydrolase domain-containing protein n=1 Tax=Novosphingobium sp. TaxID=1874826 RepID=UPI0025D5454B|nr:serine hydrolase domain-containing protein [Novosphingobium sp.]